MAKSKLFADVARDWWERYMLQGNVEYANESWRRLELEVMPRLGDKPLGKITSPAILSILRRIERRGAQVVARKVKSHISQIMRYGIACGLVRRDPARDLGWALTPHKSIPRAAITDPRQIGALMASIERLKNRRRRCELKLAALFFVRPGELRTAAWDDVEWDTATWRVPAEKMKMKRPHSVPLSRQALDVLRELRGITGEAPWLFPARGDKARHEGPRALSTALRSLGYGPDVMSAHGFRAMAATSLSEMGWPSEVIERQLAHVDKNRVRAAYQRSELLGERRKMMQAWADYLDLRCAWAILGR